jgi:hypothetical protein
LEPSTHPVGSQPADRTRQTITAGRRAAPAFAASARQSRDIVTLVHEDRELELAGARATHEGLWLSPTDVTRVTGWTPKTEGLCRDETCVPVPPGRAAEFVDGGAVNVAAFWRHMGHPVVRDDARGTWVLGTGAHERADRLRSLEAPDFTLPDLDGRPHALPDRRGKQALLVTWASW